FLIAEEVEEVAKLFILANSLGHVQIIDHREMEKIEKLFQSYGKPR
ncbi:MAG: fuculose phosphate aldolase, partial [Firmicutes bacterium]|nr:fuculose phosphate aldolase [Bacillota bacterium]